MNFPLHPPREWFETPEPSAPHPLTIEADGRVYGHLAVWDQCHTGFAGECMTPPKDLATFHSGSLQTAEGDEIPIGKLVFATKHAPMEADAVTASRHYDDTGHVGAYLRATKGKVGIWLAGALRHDISPAELQQLRANPPSGDWRTIKGRLELISALAVGVPGYPISREQMALAASGEIATLILPGYTDENEEAPVAEEGNSNNSETLISQTIASGGVVVLTGGNGGTTSTAAVEPSEETPKAEQRSKEYLRQRSMITASIDQEAALVAAPTVFTARQRQRMAKAGTAMPDGSFPIRNCQDAMDARRSIGRTPPGRRAAVMAHIRKRESALGCSSQGD